MFCDDLQGEVAIKGLYAGGRKVVELQLAAGFAAIRPQGAGYPAVVNEEGEPAVDGVAGGTQCLFCGIEADMAQVGGKAQVFGFDERFLEGPELVESVRGGGALREVGDFVGGAGLLGERGKVARAQLFEVGAGLAVSGMNSDEGVAVFMAQAEVHGGIVIAQAMQQGARGLPLHACGQGGRGLQAGVVSGGEGACVILAGEAGAGKGKQVLGHVFARMCAFQV